MAVERNLKILLTILGVALLGNVVIWLMIINLVSDDNQNQAMAEINAKTTTDINIEPAIDITTESITNTIQSTGDVGGCSASDYSDDREKELEAMKNDLLVVFKNEQAAGTDRQIICRTGRVGIEQVAARYVFSEILSVEELDKIKQFFGQTPFYLNRQSMEDVSNSADGFSELIYYGVETGQVDINKTFDYKGNAPTIEERQFTERYSELANFFNNVIVDENKMENLVDAVHFNIEKEHDFRVVEWPFENIALKNGQPTYAENVYSIEIPTELKDEVGSLYAQIDKGLLYVTTDYGVFQTYIISQTNQIHYAAVAAWDQDFLGFAPLEVDTRNQCAVMHPNTELLQAVKSGDLKISTYYYQNPESNKIEVYRIHTGAWHSTLEKLDDFCK